VVFRGACDASGAVPLSDRQLIVADDEDNVLRVYDAEVGGAPVVEADVSAALGLSPKGKKHPRMPEVDLEAATRLGERAYWLTSHGRSARGKPRPERLRLFATAARADHPAELIGQPYDRLLADAVAAPGLSGFALDEAAARGPKEPGGLNLEGMTATARGEVILGFRNPIPHGRALLVPLLNIGDLVAGAGPARFGEPVLLDLGGLGVRAISFWRGRYLVVGGRHDEGGTARLFAWSGAGAAEPLAVDLAGYNPEGMFTPDERDQILLLSDDGTRPIDDVPCKDLRDPARKRFRGLWPTPR
jgi:hypothetical protein